MSFSRGRSSKLLAPRGRSGHGIDGIYYQSQTRGRSGGRRSNSPWPSVQQTVQRRRNLSSSQLGSTSNQFAELEEDSHMIDLKEYLALKEEKLKAYLQQQKEGSKASSSGSGSKPEKKDEPQASMAQVLLSQPVQETSSFMEPILQLPYPEDDQWLNDPWYLKQRYLDRYGYLVSDYKYRYVYEAMLITTGSVEIRHFYANNNPTKEINYSQCFIKKIFNITDWGNDPFKSKTLRIAHDPQKEYLYNYWDYMNAWTFTFYYENARRKHSWFFRIREEFFENTKVIPRWFYAWWRKFGPAISLLPSQAQDLYDPWLESHPILSPISQKIYEGQPLFYFWAEFHIPWIWKWGLIIEPDDLGIPTLYRTFHFQWWKQIDLQNLISEIKGKIDEYSSQIHHSEDESDSKSVYISQLRKSLKRRYPKASDKEIMAKCLEHLKNEFSQTFDFSFGDTKTQMSVDTQSSHSGHSHESVLPGEAQNPEDDIPNPEDILESAIEMLRQDKGKGKAE